MYHFLKIRRRQPALIYLEEKMITHTIIVGATSSEGVKHDIPFKCWRDGKDIYVCLDIGEQGGTMHSQVKNEDIAKEHCVMFFHSVVGSILEMKREVIEDYLNSL